MLAALVIPVDRDGAAEGRQDDLDSLRDLVAPAPVVVLPRRRSPWIALDPRHPYVVSSRPAPRDLCARVRKAAPDATAVIVFSYKSHRIGRVLAEGLGLPAVLRQHNLEGKYHRSMARALSAPRSWLVAVEALRIEVDERRLERAAWLDGIADISAVDARERSTRSARPVMNVPTFALGPRRSQQQGDPTPTRDAATVVFLGALDVTTNQEAVQWFAQHVWPIVADRIPNAHWNIVGRRPAESIRRLADRTERASLHADVADPGLFLRTATVAINPAVSGSGVNIKLVEYLAAGTPVVSTTRGMLGLSLEAEQHLAVHDDPDAFAAAVITLLSDPERAQVLGRSGQERARAVLDTSASVHQLAGMLNADKAEAVRLRARRGESTRRPERHHRD